MPANKEFDVVKVLRKLEQERAKTQASLNENQREIQNRSTEVTRLEEDLVAYDEAIATLKTAEEPQAK